MRAGNVHHLMNDGNLTFKSHVSQFQKDQLERMKWNRLLPLNRRRFCAQSSGRWSHCANVSHWRSRTWFSSAALTSRLVLETKVNQMGHLKMTDVYIGCSATPSPLDAAKSSHLACETFNCQSWISNVDWSCEWRASEGSSNNLKKSWKKNPRQESVLLFRSLVSVSTNSEQFKRRHRANDAQRNDWPQWGEMEM